MNLIICMPFYYELLRIIGLRTSNRISPMNSLSEIGCESILNRLQVKTTGEVKKSRGTGKVNVS